MDINDLRSLVTLAGFAVFVAIIGWAYNPRRKAKLDSVARSVLED